MTKHIPGWLMRSGQVTDISELSGSTRFDRP